MLLVQLSAGFQSLPLLPTSKLGPSGADSQMGGFVYVLVPYGLSSELSCAAGSFSCHHYPHRFLSPEGLSLYFPSLEPWVVQSVLLPSCSSWFKCTKMWDHPLCQPPPCHTSSPPSCLSPPLLLVWMNVTSLTSWLSDFHTV